MVSARQEYTSAIHLDLLVILIPGIFFITFCTCSSSKFNTNSWWEWLVNRHILSEVTCSSGFDILKTIFCNSSSIPRLIMCYHLYSDITALAKDKIYTHINLNEMTINQVSSLSVPPSPSFSLEHVLWSYFVVLINWKVMALVCWYF